MFFVLYRLSDCIWKIKHCLIIIIYIITSVEFTSVDIRG